jgi:hypothetical protein
MELDAEFALLVDGELDRERVAGRAALGHESALNRVRGGRSQPRELRDGPATAPRRATSPRLA